MIVKFLASKKSRGAGAVDYVLSKKKHEKSAPKILRGDEQKTRDIISDIKFKQKATFGVLSFLENDIPKEQKEQLMNEFEEIIFCGLSKDDVNILWVEHRDKDRLELNFIIPKINLRTKQSFNPYYFKQDQKRIDTWKKIKNLEFGYHSPDDPDNSQTFVKSKNKAVNTNIETLESNLFKQIENNTIQSRDELISYIENSGVTITRKAKDSISIKFSNSKKAIRLKGGIYGEKFTDVGSIRDIIAEQRAEIERYKTREKEKEREDLQSTLEELTEHKKNELLKKFGSSDNDSDNDSDVSISNLLATAVQNRESAERTECREINTRTKSRELIKIQERTRAELQSIARPTIERIEIQSDGEFDKERGIRVRLDDNTRRAEKKAEQIERKIRDEYINIRTRVEHSYTKNTRELTRRVQQICITDKTELQRELAGSETEIQSKLEYIRERERKTTQESAKYDERHDRATQSLAAAIRGLRSKISRLGERVGELIESISKGFGPIR
jgi:hypothetical protein